MYPLKRFLVCLDLSPMDKTLLEYAAALTSKTPDAKVYFIHVSKRFEVPEEIKKSFPGVTGPPDEILEKEMEASVEKYFKPSSQAAVDLAVAEGNATEQILKWSQLKEIDLIVMGLKNKLKGSGSNPAKIASVCRSSVLFVPENARFDLKRILIPTDFSTHSALAYEEALEVCRDSSCQLIFQNVYKVPVGYHYTGKDYAEFAIIMKRNAEKQMKDFLRRIKVSEESVKTLCSIDDDEKPADVIYQEAQAQQADLIILGSKGRTTAAAFLVGSVAVNLLQQNKTVPYMIVKDKKTNMGFFEAFKNL